MVVIYQQAMRKDLATHGKHGKQKKASNKENKQKATLKTKQRYEKDEYVY